MKTLLLKCLMELSGRGASRGRIRSALRKSAWAVVVVSVAVPADAVTVVAVGSLSVGKAL